MKYLVYYDIPENKAENRSYALAAASKIDYICDALNRLGEPVELISASRTRNRRGCRGRTVQLSEGMTLKLFPCMGSGIPPKRLLGRILFKAWLFVYLLLRIRKGETLLVYHSLEYMGMVRLLRKLRDFRLILEVEEIYADVTGREKDRKREYRLFSGADAYLFPTALLHEKINIEKKPYVLIHGTYRAEPHRGYNVFSGNPQEAEKIHCVYAGTFDPRKGGSLAAGAAAACLPETYHIHILGFGNREQTKRMRELVDELAQKSRCGITFDGTLTGEEYIRFLQSCHIGLSTQNPDAAFNDTSFPSKILSYLANGLRVVSVRIPAVEGSAVGQYLHYYDEQTPEAVAGAIMRIDPEDSNDGHGILEELDRKFLQDLEALLKNDGEMLPWTE